MFDLKGITTLLDNKMNDAIEFGKFKNKEMFYTILTEKPGDEGHFYLKKNNE